VIILRLLRRLLANDVLDIPRVDGVAAKNMYKEMPTEYVSLVVERQKRLASAFREHMTEGQTYHTTNSNRRTFYTDVTNMAKQVNFLSLLVFVRMTVFSSLWKGAIKLTTKRSLTMASTFGKAKACKKWAKCSVAS
jgi:hypothetical protein